VLFGGTVLNRYPDGAFNPSPGMEESVEVREWWWGAVLTLPWPNSCRIVVVSELEKKRGEGAGLQVYIGSERC
jgi:hypothetical protein